MTGAGISMSAGIPDFRSPDTGLYANLARLNLPYAEAVFDISYFRKNPLPFYTLAHELYPGRYRPTITHSFISLLNKKGLLHRLFTQNIDCLEREAGVPDDKIVEAHGSFATQRCIECRTPYSEKEMREHVKKMEVPRCTQSHCQGLVKPDIVFFGEQLPAKFFQEREAPAQADLCFVMGTSLTVQPFASLPSFVDDRVPRVLINLERVGGIGNRSDDVLVLGDCDTGVRKIAEACGWLEELEAEWALTSTESAEAAKTDADSKAAEVGAPKDRDAALEAAVEKLTREVDETLKISSDHIERIKAEHAGENLPIDGDEAMAYTGEKLKAQLEKTKGETSQEMVTEVEGSKDAMTAKIKQDVLNPSEGQGLDHVYPHIKKSSL
ncbi:NAD-dependent deacetylase sirtuin-2 [Viridothelium virens]|uniref:NAD-dependent deacetylase sirtuin-2 n=1 Tax=Viridothelium virens TaxID=1048519 RepID=A0A6A6H8R2_VIRVR|nr:NAD-dependent deacetylase sirtuin-2 [Viridothelium virens]